MKCAIAQHKVKEEKVVKIQGLIRGLIKRKLAIEAAAVAKFNIGDKVEVKRRGENGFLGRMKNGKFPGKIEKVNSDRTFNIKHDFDGWVDKNVSDDYIIKSLAPPPAD